MPLGEPVKPSLRGPNFAYVPPAQWSFSQDANLPQEEDSSQKEEVREMQEKIEALEELIERMVARQEALVVDATGAILHSLITAGVDPSEALDQAEELVEQLRATFRKEFMTTMAKNLVEERDLLRKEVDQLKEHMSAMYRKGKLARDPGDGYFDYRTNYGNPNKILPGPIWSQTTTNRFKI